MSDRGAAGRSKHFVKSCMCGLDMVADCNCKKGSNCLFTFAKRVSVWLFPIDYYQHSFAGFFPPLLFSLAVLLLILSLSLTV